MVNPVISELARKGMAIRQAQAQAQQSSRDIAAQLRPERPPAAMQAAPAPEQTAASQ